MQQNKSWSDVAVSKATLLLMSAVPQRKASHALGHTILMDVSTLGEILRVELPGNISARIDEWTKP